MLDHRNLTDRIDAECGQEVEIRRTADGAIDLNHYRRRGRVLHGLAIRFALYRSFTLPYRRIAQLCARSRRRFGYGAPDGIVPAG